MKNYYEILGVSEIAKTEEIKQAYQKEVKYWLDIYKTTSDDQEKFKANMKLYELNEAWDILSDQVKRIDYDTKLDEYRDKNDLVKKDNTENKKSNSNLRMIAGALALATVFGVGGYVLGNRKNTKVNTVSYSTSNSSSVSEENEEKLTAENFEQKTKEILDDNKAKGLNIDPMFVKSALFITNIDYLTEEDIKLLYGNTNLNMIEEIQNMYNYTSAVGTHNASIALGQKEGSYITLAPLAYDSEDKKILEELNTEFVDLANDLKSEEMTSEEYQSSFKYVTEFYTGDGYLTTDNQEYSNYSLTAGGGLLSEQYWPMFSVVYANSQFLTSENYIDIKTLSEGTNGNDAVINGSKYLAAIINHETLACLEEDKTLSKTQ